MTAPASSILDRLRRLGGTLSIMGGQLVIEAPEGAVCGELLVNIKAHKPDLLDLLDEQARWPDGVLHWLAGVMDGPVAEVAHEVAPNRQDFSEAGDVGTIKYRAHLARIRRCAASRAEPGKTEAAGLRLTNAATATRPVGGGKRVADAVSMREKVLQETP